MQNSRFKLIAIDPDVKKSGVAIYDGKDMSLIDMNLWEVFDELKLYRGQTGYLVIIEAGWINKDGSEKKNKSFVAGGKGSAYDVGRNAEVGRQIEKLCKAYDINYRLMQPQGYSDKKWTHEVFCKHVGIEFKRTNPETRVAGLFAYDYYNLFSKINTKKCK